MNSNEPAWKRILSITSNVVMINALFLLCSIPVVTIGQAWCGLYTAIRYAIRGEGWFAGFKAGFKTRFLRGVVSWTVCMVLIVYMALNFLSMLEIHTAAVVVHGVFLLVAMMFAAALQPLNVYVPTGKTQWLINAVNLCTRAPLQLALVGAMMWVPAALVVVFLKFGFFEPFFFVMVFLLGYFALTALVSTIILKSELARMKIENEQLQEQEEE